MSDINELHSASVTKLVGANNITGIEDNFVDADINGNLKVIDYATSSTGTTVPTNASLIGTKNPSGILTAANSDAYGNILVTTVTSSLPATTIDNQAAINAGVTQFTTYTATQKIALKQFYAGGTGIGKQVLYSYSPNVIASINAGDFETSGDISSWPYFSFGGSGTGSVALSTAQFHTGTHSIAVTFTTGDATHSNGVKQTFSTPVDYSSWRYVSCWMYNPALFSGETTSQTRTITIMLTDSGGATRSFVTSYSTGTMTTGWIQFQGDITNPTSATGTSFDSTSISSIELRFVNSANKAGTVYFDTAQLISQTRSLFPIYHPANVSFNISIDPVFIMNIGDQILISQTNNDATRKEFFALTSGVPIA